MSAPNSCCDPHVHPDPAALLLANAQWAADVKESDPCLFKQNASGQWPKVVWIGCSDSRVPESVITASRPGDVFGHRNIANQFHLHDDNAQSVLFHAISALEVDHVIVVGHTDCGGADACFHAARVAAESNAHPPIPIIAAPADAPINRWLTPLAILAASLRAVNPDVSVEEGIQTLLVANVQAQLDNLCKAKPVVSAWADRKRKPLWVHGWLYEVETGTLRDLKMSKGPPEHEEV